MSRITDKQFFRWMLQHRILTDEWHDPQNQYMPPHWDSEVVTDLVAYCIRAERKKKRGGRK
jgi:hypothetical protein